MLVHEDVEEEPSILLALAGVIAFGGLLGWLVVVIRRRGGSTVGFNISEARDVPLIAAQLRPRKREERDYHEVRARLLVLDTGICLDVNKFVARDPIWIDVASLGSLEVVPLAKHLSGLSLGFSDGTALDLETSRLSPKLLAALAGLESKARAT